MPSHDFDPTDATKATGTVLYWCYDTAVQNLSLRGELTKANALIEVLTDTITELTVEHDRLEEKLSMLEEAWANFVRELSQ